ncbi:O-antigen ligase family protein [Patescibacteria group bacterium]|nr:O-antigen ligase family protein [Patescibacteria group bacterium]
MTSTISRYIVYGALFGALLIPLIVFNGFFFPFITGKAFFFRIIVEIGFAAYAVLALAEPKYRPKWSWVFAAFALFVLWTFVADLFAVNPEKAFWSNFERMEGWVTVIHLFLYFLMASAVLTADDLWKAWWKTSLGVSVYISIYGIFQLLGLAAIHQGGVRLDASFGNATYLAVYLLLSSVVAAWLAFEARGWERYTLGAVAVLDAVIMIFTATRGAVLGLIAAALVAAALAALLSGGRARRIAAGGIIALVVIVGGFMLIRNTSFVRNDPTLTRIADISLAQGEVRFEIWHMAWLGILERPLAGWGQEGFNYVFNQYYDPALYQQEPWFDRAHNEFIDWAVAGGIPAFLLWLALYGTVLLAFWKGPFTNSERIAFTAFLVAYAVNDLFVFDNLMSYVFFIAVLAYAAGRSGTPFKKLEALPAVSRDRIDMLVAPVAGVVAVMVLYAVNVPNMLAASDLITAITPAASVQTNLDGFDKALADGSFASQEIREQIVSFASGVVGDQNISNTDKIAVVTKAITEMQKEVALIPKDARLRLELASAYSFGSDFKDAIAEMDEALKLSPTKEALFVQRGMLKWEGGDAAGAKADFDAAYALGPSFTELAAYAAVGHVITGDVKGAHAVLLSAFATTTVDNSTLMLAYYRMQDWPDLIALWQLRLSEDASVSNYFGLAASYAIAGKLSDSAAVIHAAVAAHPEAKAQADSLLQQLAHPSSTAGG